MKLAAIAVNYYYPQYFPFKRTLKPEVANPSSLTVDDNWFNNEIEKPKPKTIRRSGPRRKAGGRRETNK